MSGGGSGSAILLDRCTDSGGGVRTGHGAAGLRDMAGNPKTGYIDEFSWARQRGCNEVGGWK